MDKSAEKKEGKNGSESLGSQVDVSPAQSFCDGNDVTDSILLEVLGILEVMEKHDDARRATESLRDLFHLLYCDHETANKNQREPERHGAPDSILRAMTRFESDEDVQVQGCRCLTALFYSKSKGCWVFSNGDDICFQMFQSHGMALIERIAKAAKNFPDRLRVQEACYGALTNLFANSRRPCLGHFGQDRASPLDEVTARFVNELDGIAMVVGAMKQYPDQSRLQRRCCLLLAYFANQDDLRAVIQKANVGSLVGAVLDNHAKDAKLVASVKYFFDVMCH